MTVQRKNVILRLGCCSFEKGECMLVYPDKLYGEWMTPHIVERLIHTKEMVRVRNIAQSNIPNILSPFGPLPSRFHHCMGVCFLAWQVIKANMYSLSESEQTILLISALFHDAGNPPFSHLSERFLQAIYQKNGESFLENILDGSEAEAIFKEYDISVNQILKMVMGQDKPLSDILHGSMDIDNLDNIPRFLNALGSGEGSSFMDLASAFRYNQVEGWHLPLSAMNDARRWQKMRKCTYKQVYGTLYANIMTMLSRAVELAFAQGSIKNDFFFLDDVAALAYLQKNGGAATNFLLNCLMRWDWFREILSLEWTHPRPSVMHRLSASWEDRYVFTKTICERVKIPEEKICVFFEKGKEVRNVTIPFLGGDRLKVDYDNLPVLPMTRLRIYVHEDLATQTIHRQVKEIVSEIL